MISFDNKGDLQKWLEERGIDTGAWRSPSAKRLGDLWREIIIGEATIQDDPPLRLVNVVQVVIRKGENVLVEAEQQLRDGDRRSRHQLPSEKMKPDESVTDAALRCLKEEMGVGVERVSLDSATVHRSRQEAESPSYPGLTTRYSFYTVEAEVEDLPDVDFWYDNAAFLESGDPVRRHHWEWRPADL